MSIRALLVSALLAALTACSGSTSVTRTGKLVQPRDPNCEFEVLTASPAEGFVEIGTVDYEYGTTFSAISVLSEFKARIRRDVCSAGGDAALASIDGHGRYTRATILRSVPGAAVSPTSAPANGGCQFDTQCKDDRVCVKGECSDPAKK